MGKHVGHVNIDPTISFFSPVEVRENNQLSFILLHNYRQGKHAGKVFCFCHFWELDILKLYITDR